MLALVRGDVICLVDSATGRELAALDAPELDRPTYTEFSPDGTPCLAATTEDRDSIHVWDLQPDPFATGHPGGSTGTGPLTLRRRNRRGR